jgi:biopolymer transport protein ExbB
MDIQQRLTAFALLGATWVMWLLVVLSIISVAVIIERTYYILASRGDIEGLMRELFALLQRGNLKGAAKLLQESKTFEAKIALVGIASAESGPEAARERMAAEQQLARLQMERNLAFLGTVGNNAPFVGLLGTVIGVIRAFHTLDETAGRVTAGLMADIGEALVATAIGILVALPAVAGFNLFQRVIRGRMARSEAMADHVIAHLKSNGNSGADGPESDG